MGIIEGLIGGVATLISGSQQAKVARYNTDRTIQANKELAQYGYSKDLEMWNKGNEYNSPAAQMERLKEAGLNPNLVYGTGSVAGNTSGSLPQYNAPSVRYDYKAPVDWGNVLANFQDVQLRQAKIDNVKAQTEGINLSNQLKAYDRDYMQSVIESNIMRVLKDNDAQMSEAQMKLLRKEWEFSNFEDMKKTWSSELINTQADAQSAVFDKQIKEVAAQFAKAQMLVNMITKGVGAAAGAVGATGILRATQSAVKTAKPVLSSKTVKAPGYEAVYNYK